MTLDELNDYLRNLPEQVKETAPNIVAETAVEYYKATFTLKGFDGVAWRAGRPKPTGSLLVQSGNLMNSIRPDYVGTDRVVVSAGSPQVPYARVHNEGFDGIVSVQSHKRSKRGSNTARKNKNVLYGGDTVVEAHTRHMRMPKRPFMGHARQLTERIVERINEAINHILNNP